MCTHTFPCLTIHLQPFSLYALYSSAPPGFSSHLRVILQSTNTRLRSSLYLTPIISNAYHTNTHTIDKQRWLVKSCSCLCSKLQKQMGSRHTAEWHRPRSWWLADSKWTAGNQLNGASQKPMTIGGLTICADCEQQSCSLLKEGYSSGGDQIETIPLVRRHKPTSLMS
jgi:hypothetical protein